MQFGAFPVFVVDGSPSHLKSQARIARFFRSSGIDSSSLPVAEDGIPAERNSTFTKYVQECVVSSIHVYQFGKCSLKLSLFSTVLCWNSSLFPGHSYSRV